MKMAAAVASFRRERQNTSKVWKYFRSAGDNVVCILCKTSLAFHGSTSTMIEHLKRKHTGSVADVSTKKKTTPNVNMAVLWRSEIQEQKMSLSTTWSLLNQTQPTPVFCVACETKFLDKRSLEDHECPAVSFICTCGTGFTDYVEMVTHRDGHNDLSSFQTDHISIMKHRAKDTQLHELKLRMLKSIDEKLQQVQAPNIPVPLVSPPLMYTQLMAPPTSSGTPVLSSDQSLPSATAYNASSKTTTSTALPLQPRDLVLPRSGATVNLSGRFQPAVLLNTKNKFNRGYRYMCETCRVVFWERKLLLEHVASHFPTQIYGCQHCGILLISNTPPSSSHSCGTYHASHGERFTTGQCVGDIANIGQKRNSLTRCPYCPTTYFQPWFLSRHIKSAHSGKDMPSLPQNEKDKAKTKSLKETAMASLESGKSDEPVKKMLGHKMINGMVNRTVSLHDEKMPPPAVENVMAASQAVLEMIKQITEGSVAEGSVMKVAQKMKDDLQQHNMKTETATVKKTLDQCRCVICGKNLETIQMLEQHWCSRKLMLLRRSSLPLKYTNGYRHRPAPYSVAGRDSDGMVTVRLQTSHNTDTCEPVLKNVRVDPTKLSCTALYRSVAVQTKVEFDDGSYDGAINTCMTDISFPTKT